jgi:hypothetical protein
MAFHLRSLSARRYRVDGEMPSVESPAFAKRLTDRRFRALGPKEERAFGWVSVDNLLETTFHPGTLSRGAAAAFALRIDRRRPDARLVRATLDLEERAARAAQGDGPKKRRREERQEMRRAISERLLEEAKPTVEVHSVLYFPRTKTVLYLSLSRPSNETFRTHFADTFDTTLSTLTPYHRAVELLADRGASEALAPLRRAEFARTGMRASVAEALR